MKSFDIIWIGTGQATGTVVPRLSAAGKTVAVIERDRFGGSCVNYGCTPTKTLVASARAAHMVRRSGEFGIDVESVNINFPAVMKRMDDYRRAASSGFESWIAGMDGVEIFHGEASFSGSHSVEVGNEEIEGREIIIHTGTRARSISVPGLEDIAWLDSDGLLDLKSAPDHLLIVGGSYIGLEFAQVFTRLGVKVSVLEASAQIMFREDDDIASAARDFLTREGVEILDQVKLHSFAKTATGFEARISSSQGDKTISASHLLLGTGRIPNTDKLNLEAAGVKVNDRGYIEVDDHGKSSAPHIYALGDVNSRGAFTHTSVHDGEVFLDHYLQSGDRRISDRTLVYSMYTDPPLGRIGMNEKQARESGKNILMGVMQMSEISRAKEKSETDGLVKLIVDGDDNTMLGATVLGVGGDEIISMFAPLLYEKTDVSRFRKMVLPHPTVSELMPWVLDRLTALK